MKNRVLTTLAGAALIFLCVGCKTVNAPLPANAINSIDAQINSVLQPAHAFAADLTAAVQSTDPQVHIELTAAQKTVLTALNQALNVADPLEQAYHASGAATPSPQLQTAVSNVQAAFAAAQVAIPPNGK